MEHTSATKRDPAPASPPPRRRITPRALLEARRLSDPKIHPDGRHIAFVVTEADFQESRWVSHLWLTEWLLAEETEPGAEPPAAPEEANAEATDEGTGEDEDPTRQLTFSRDGESHPKWSPDGRYLAFLSTRIDETEPEPEEEEDDEPKEQVWILPIDGGEARKVTTAPEGVLEYEWTPDGSALIYLAPEPRPRPIESLRKQQQRQKNDPVVEHEDRLRRQFWRVDIEENKPKRLFTADYGVTEFALSADGERLCYTTNYTGEWNDYHKVDLWVCDLTTDTPAPFQLIERAGGKYHPRWSPDGTQIAFLSWLDPELSYSRETLFVVDAPLSPTLTPLKDTSPLNPPLSPAPPSDAAVLAPGSGGRTGEGRTDLPNLSPYQGEMSASNLNTRGEEASRISPVQVSEVKTSATPFPVSVANVPGKGAGGLGLDYDIKEFQWTHEQGALIALAAVGTGSALYRLSAEEATRLDVGGPDVECEGLDYDLESGALAFVQETASALPEIVLRTAAGEVHPLTRLNAEFTETYRLPRQEVVTWTSFDGTEIEGVLTYPLDYEEGKRAPLIVQIHGGPKARATNTLQAYGMPSVWSAEGYAVLQPNYRGSEGYGNAFAVANRRDLGGGDFADIMAGVDWCIAQGIADPEQLGVLGGSYGGFLTNWAIGHTDRFRAAISLFGIFHLQTDFGNSELSRWDTDYLGATYWEDPEIYRRLSPGSYIEAIKTPTLILHGEQDSNTFISNSKEMYQALRQRGVTTQFVHYPREGHGLQEPNHRLDEIRRCLAWMDRYVRHGGQNPGVYRIGDKVPSADGTLELCVVGAEVGAYLGRPESEADEGPILLEISLTLHNTDTRLPLAPQTFRLDAIRLEPDAPSHSEQTVGDSATVELETMTPIGVPVAVPGGKVLVEGETLRFVQYPDAETGRLEFACAAVFRLPSAGGEYRLRVADFPPVTITGIEAEKRSKNTEESAEAAANL